MVTINSIVAELKKKSLPVESVDLTVNKDPVWDYKDQDGQLRLIHENNLETKGYEKVLLKELMTPEFENLPIVSEMFGDCIDEVEIYRTGKHYSINFTIKLD